MPTEQETKLFQAFTKALREGDLEKVAKALEKGANADLYPGNALGESHLLMAVRGGKPLELIKLLVEKGRADANRPGKGGATPLTEARKARRKDVLAYFEGRGAAAPAADPDAERDAELFEAVENWQAKGFVARIKKLIGAGANPNARNDEQRTPLLVLCSEGGGKTAIAALIGLGADVRAQDEEGDSALHLLISSDADGAVEAAKALLDAGLPVDTANETAETPLHAAARARAGALVTLLLERGADHTRKDEYGRRPADLADGPLKDRLLAHGAPETAPRTLALLEAVVKNDLRAVERLCKEGADPCAVDGNEGRAWGPHEIRGVAALHAAFFFKIDPAIADFLLSRPKLDVNVRSLAGKTPLHFLMGYHQGPTRLRLVKRLLQLGADPNAADSDNETPLAELKPGEEPELLDALEARGASGAGKRQPAGPPAPVDSPARKTFVAVTGGKLAGLEGATTKLKVGRRLVPVALFDWFRWLDQDSRHVEDIEGAQLHEGAERFERDELIPFGVVGMTGALDSYEETSVDGTLFLDVSGAKGKDAPVVMAPSDGGDVREVAGGYRALMKTLDQA